LVIGAVSGSPAIAADDCAVTGVLNNARFSGLGEGSTCSDSPPLGGASKHWWLPQRGSEVYGYMTTGAGLWALSVSAASEAIPQSLLCTVDVSLDGVRLTASDPVDLSWPEGFPVMPGAKRTAANGSVGVDLTAVARALASPRTGTASFAVDCGGVGTARWTIPHTVVPDSPAGRDTGVSIDDGADFTNNPDVLLHLGWKAWPIDKVKVSNDGGFAPSKTRVFDLTSGDPLPWRLVVLGNERLPKTVYVRFHSPSRGAGWDQITYSDDIVLDTVVPQILSLTITQPGATSLASSRRTLRVKAKDNRSGVQSIQISKGKPRKKAKVVKYRKAVAAPGSGRLFVRVRDGAGNWSKWRGVA
jgi:hypothetical protein